MRMPTRFVYLLGGTGITASLALGGCGGDDGNGAPLFPIKPECMGAAITPYMGTNPLVISKLEIGSAEDGFDLDGDGMPDNRLANVAGVARDPIANSFKSYSIVIPFEFFDAAAGAADDCVKFAIYLGAYVKDIDADGGKASVKDGDCNDHDPAINKGVTEVLDNGKDDNCDGVADEGGSDGAADTDGDGQTIAAGDCDDHNPMVKKGLAEICDDGFDNDCDGVADRTSLADGTSTACTPFLADAQIPLDPLSFSGTDPVIVFNSGTIKDDAGTLMLEAGPSLFGVSIPVKDGVTLTLKITGATIRAEVVPTATGFTLQHGHLGGVLDAKTADTIRGLEVTQIGLTAEDSLLDAVFGPTLGAILNLPKASAAIRMRYAGCNTPDIDVDRDGLEAFCDSKPDDLPNAVDICIDGDGTEVEDILGADGKVMMHCTEAVNSAGKDRFVDGVSVELNFETTTITKIKP